MKRSPQQELPGMAAALAPPERRCDLCDQKLDERKVCKWCWKGGVGDPPAPRGPAWRQWIRGLIKTCSMRLRAAGHGEELIGRTIEAIFSDRGRVPLEVKDLVREYEARPVSGRRYWRAIDTAVLRHQIMMCLVSGGWTTEEADRIAGRATSRIMDQREIEAADPDAPRVPASAFVHEEAERELAEAEAQVRVDAGGPRVALGRIAAEDDQHEDDDEEDALAEQEVEATPARARVGG
jgi:hypothetical protein